MADLKPCPCCGRPMIKDPISANRGLRTPVVSISEDGVRTHYPSVQAAAKAVDANIGQISKAVNLGKMYRGMMWEKVGERNG